MRIKFRSRTLESLPISSWKQSLAAGLLSWGANTGRPASPSCERQNNGKIGAKFAAQLDTIRAPPADWWRNTEQDQQARLPSRGQARTEAKDRALAGRRRHSRGSLCSSRASEYSLQRVARDRRTSACLRRTE